MKFEARARALVLATVCVSALGARCHGAGGREVPPDSKPEADAGAETGALSNSVQGPPLWVVLDDPRFADARALEDDAHHAEAAAALDADLAKTTSAKEKCTAEYVIGRLRALAGDDANAAAAFDLAATGDCAALFDYARERAAAAYERAGKPDDAIARASAIVSKVAIADEAVLVRAEALAAKGDRVQALGIWRDQLGKHAHGARWVDTAVRLATALLDGVDGDAKSRAKEAFDLATRVVIEAPTLEDTSGAVAQRKRAIALDASLARELSVDERIKRAKALLDASQPDKARTEIDGALAAMPAKDRAASEPACRASQVRAQAIAKSKKGSAAEAWGDAIRACGKEQDALAGALYNGAKASAGPKPDEALERYGRIEKEFPKHRLADDARLASALILHDRDAAKFETMLLALPDDYPEGDMRGEALFRVALARMARGDWEGAKAPLDRNVQIDGASHHWATAGRAAYFRAKCAAKTGDAEGAKKQWVEIVKGYPLAYYMAQSYGRVAESDAALAKSTLDAAMAAEPAGAWLTREHAELASDEMKRAVALLEVGEIDWAKREMLAAGVTAEGADPEMVWYAASLFDRADAFDVGHQFSRGRLSDHLLHFPSGRWRFAWEAAYPRAFASLVTKTATETNVPAPVLWGVMREESAFIADVKSPSNAHGLMQLLPSTAREVARGTSYSSDETALHVPRVSIALGAKLLAGLRASFPDNPSLAIPSYNAGAGAIRAWLRARAGADYDLWVEQIPYEETRGYIKRVLQSELIYAELYAPEVAKEVLALPSRVSSTP
jgi:soluble lytic murein transglycosylase